MSKYNKNELENLILIENKSYEEIGRRFGVSGAAIKKAAFRLGIELISRRNINEKETFNKGNYKIKRDIGHCICCGKDFIKYANKTNKYCSKECYNKYKDIEYIQNWRNGIESGSWGVKVAERIKNYFREKYNNKCQECGWGEVNNKTNIIPLQIHHIDGNALNCKEENLQLLCPNCHSLTENFGSSNLNSTRGCSPRYIKNNIKINKEEQNPNHI